jgi:hypothetical protein
MTKTNYALLIAMIGLIGCAHLQGGGELNKQKPTQALPSNAFDCDVMMSPGLFYRLKNKENDSKWGHVEVIQMFGFDHPVPVGEFVQVIPPNVDLPVRLLKVLNCTKQEGMGSPWYDLKLEEITSQDFITDDAPEGFGEEYLGYGVCIYPPIAGAQAIPLADLTLPLPQMENYDNIRVAIDFDNDGLVDALFMIACAKEFIREDGEVYCDGDVQFIEAKCNNRWVLVYESGGC